MSYIRVDEAVLRAVLEENERLKKAAGGAPLGDAIEKALKTPTRAGIDNVVGNYDTNLIDDTMRKAVFAPRDVAKARQTKQDKKQSDRDALRKARGLRPQSASPSASFQKSRGARVRES